MPQDERADSATPESTATAIGTAGFYLSETLFDGRQEIDIDHRGQRYVLRITRQGKLILNKSNEVGNERHDTA